MFGVVLRMIKTIWGSVWGGLREESEGSQKEKQRRMRETIKTNLGNPPNSLYIVHLAIDVYLNSLKVPIEKSRKQVEGLCTAFEYVSFGGFQTMSGLSACTS